MICKTETVLTIKWKNGTKIHVHWLYKIKIKKIMAQFEINKDKNRNAVCYVNCIYDTTIMYLSATLVLAICTIDTCTDSMDFWRSEGLYTMEKNRIF